MIQRKEWISVGDFPQSSLDGFIGFGELEAKLLMARGINDPETAYRFLEEDGLILSEPFDMSGMEEAIRRIMMAVERAEKIVIYGDYDADGVCATALLICGLREYGAKVNSYIPDRFNEGYGLNLKAIDQLAAAGTNLLITVDCGIRGIEEVQHARSLGIDVIVTDHHRVGELLPPANVVVNPQRKDDVSSNKHLAGVGVAFMLLYALSLSDGRELPRELLDLVAIGTVADMMLLQGENRMLVREGLRVINSGNRIGLRALIRNSGYELGKVDATTISFVLGPRLNAAGRLGSAEEALQLLLEVDEEIAKERAERLNSLNQERQALTSSTYEHVVKQLDATN